MAYIVRRRMTINGKKYLPNDPITPDGIPTRTWETLRSYGRVCEAAAKPTVSDDGGPLHEHPATLTPAPSYVAPHDLGAGWWQVGDQKIRGKAAAFAAAGLEV